MACDVTVGTKKIKVYVQIERKLGYLMMLICNGICQYVGRYAALNKACALSGKKSIADVQIDAMLRYGFSSENTFGDGHAFWIFPGFTDKG